MLDRVRVWARGPEPTATRRASGAQPGQVMVGLALVMALVAALGLQIEGPARPPWRSQVAPLPRAAIMVGDQPLTVELALTPEQQQRGLGYREGLEPGTGMLFVDQEPRLQSFWMKGMRFCLDIVWIEGGQIVGAAESVCPQPAGTPDSRLPTYRSPEPVRFVLEVPAGWLKAHGFGPGTPVELGSTVDSSS